MEVDSWIGGLPRGGGASPWIIMAGAAVLAASPVGRKVFSIAGRACEKLAKHTWVAVLTVGVLALVVSATISVLVNFPEPAVHAQDGLSWVASRGFKMPARAAAC